MLKTTLIPFSTAGRIALFAFLLAAGAALLLPRVVWGQTAMAAFRECRNDAALEANACYQSGDGYFHNRSCDLAWDVNNAVCARILIKALAF